MRAPGQLNVDSEAQGAVDPHYPWLVLHQGYTVLVSGRDGDIDGGGRTGLFDFDTRLLSRYRLVLGGRSQDYVSSSLLSSDTWTARLHVPRAGGSAEGPALPQDALELFIVRRVGRGMEERLVVRNHSAVPVETELAIELAADFADVDEVDGDRQQNGTLSRRWRARDRALTFHYDARHDGHRFERALRVRVVESDSPPAHRRRALRFPVVLAGKGEWTALIRYESLVDGSWRSPVHTADDTTDRAQERAAWDAARAHLESHESLVAPAFERAATDLFALRA